LLLLLSLQKCLGQEEPGTLGLPEKFNPSNFDFDPSSFDPSSLESFPGGDSELCGSYTGTGCASYFFCKDMNNTLVDKCFTCALAFGHTWADKDGTICDYCLAITGKNFNSAFIQAFTKQLQRIQFPCSETVLLRL
jgi:hypothetical protein